MRKVLYIYLLVSGFIISACYTIKPKTYMIYGHVTQSSDWCGGMAPGPEFDEEQRNPPPYIGLKLYIKCGGVNRESSKIYKTVITDSAGNFKLKLPAGNYIIMQAEKLKKPTIPKDDQYSKWDSACIIRYWQNGDYKLNVNDKSNKKISFDIRQHCDWNQPCLNYSGPLPP